MTTQPASQDNTVFYESESLQDAIGLALRQRKAVLCFVHDESGTSAQWASIFADESLHQELNKTTVALRLRAGSEQANLLSSFCPVQSVPTIVIIQNAQVTSNWQANNTTVADVKRHMIDQYRAEDPKVDNKHAETQSGSQSRAEGQVVELASEDDAGTGRKAIQYIELPPSSGQMRLPDNAYDHLRDQTERWLASGIQKRNVLTLQLRLLAPIHVDVIQRFVRGLRADPSTVDPALSLEVMKRLLNIPAAKMKRDAHSQSSQSEMSSPTQTVASSSPVSSNPSSTTTISNSNQPAQENSLGRNTNHNQNTSASNSSSSPDSQKIQREDYTRQQREREASARAERERIKAQIKADRDARREAEVARKRSELDALRTANSTTSNPRPTDVRIQVRRFDGSTIKTTFANEATIAGHVRPWIDKQTSSPISPTSLESTSSSVSHGAGVGRSGPGSNSAPYNLKLILTPLPNRSIEAGEEERELHDLGIKGSCTMVMVPVRGFVESYSGGGQGFASRIVNAGTAGAGSASGLLGAAVSGGYGLVTGTAGLLYGGVRTLFGNTPSTSPSTSAPAGGGGGGFGGRTIDSTTTTTSGSPRVHTLADQRAAAAAAGARSGRDEQWYNGNTLNFEPRGKDEHDKR